MTTMRDVADHAGVSISTVSHVINETRPVSEELQRRVSQAMQELGYQPNLLARGLRRGETFTIGVVVPDSANPYFAEVTRGIEDTSFDRGYSVILCNSDGDPRKEEMYANLLSEKRVDGIVFVTAGLRTDHFAQLQKQELPVVLVDRDIRDSDLDVVLSDNHRGGLIATRHLLGLGHRRIACIAGPAHLLPSAERLEGYHRALQEAGVARDERLVDHGDFHARAVSMRQAASWNWLTRPRPSSCVMT
jgi:LacI family transcriptional regulator